MAAQLHLDDAEIGQRVGFAAPVAGLPVQGQGLLVVVDGGLVAA
jgi:hypothetical protein